MIASVVLFNSPPITKTLQPFAVSSFAWAIPLVTNVALRAVIYFVIRKVVVPASIKTKSSSFICEAAYFATASFSLMFISDFSLKSSSLWRNS